jgi:hypothetical protein
MLPEAAMYVVAPGEYVRVLVEIREGVHLVYPSGWEEDHDWDSFEERLKKPPFDLVGFRERREFTSRITNFRRTIYWPNERRDRIIMRDPDRPGYYDAERAVVVPPGEIFA